MWKTVEPTTKTNDEAGYFDLDPVDMGTEQEEIFV